MDPTPFKIDRSAFVHHIRIRVFTKDGRYKYFKVQRFVFFNHSVVNLDGPRSKYSLWQRYAKLLGTKRRYYE